MWLHYMFNSDRKHRSFNKHSVEYMDKDEVTDRTRSERINVTSFRFAHSTTHVRITRQIKVLDKNGIGIFWKVEADGGGSNEGHVGFFGEAINVIL
ncbi:hypothetical protein Hanom_Chr01g00065071 [Helianthus anomalus]